MKRTPLRRRKPMRSRRATARRSGRVRDRQYLLDVKTLPCCFDVCRHAPTPWGCDGPIEADHAGERPVGRKASDDTAIPLCTRHHRQRTDYSGVFLGWNAQYMRLWCNDRIAETREAVARLRAGMEAAGL